jgi:hypothetical protein
MVSASFVMLGANSSLNMITDSALNYVAYNLLKARAY